MCLFQLKNAQFAWMNLLIPFDFTNSHAPAVITNLKKGVLRETLIKQIWDLDSEKTTAFKCLVRLHGKPDVWKPINSSSNPVLKTEKDFRFPYSEASVATTWKSKYFGSVWFRERLVGKLVVWNFQPLKLCMQCSIKALWREYFYLELPANHKTSWGKIYGLLVNRLLQHQGTFVDKNSVSMVQLFKKQKNKNKKKIQIWTLAIHLSK